MATALVGGVPLRVMQNGDGSMSLAASVVGAGLGDLTAIPAGTTNGTPLGVKPANAIGARIYLGASDTVTFTIKSAQPSSAPSPTVTISGANGPAWDENLSDDQMIYVTAKTGSPSFRWY